MDLDLLGDFIFSSYWKNKYRESCLYITQNAPKIEVCLYIFKYNTWFEFGITQPLETNAIKVTC